METELKHLNFAGMMLWKSHGYSTERDINSVHAIFNSFFGGYSWI